MKLRLNLKVRRVFLFAVFCGMLLDPRARAEDDSALIQKAENSFPIGDGKVSDWAAESNNHHVFGLSVAVFSGGKILWARGYGTTGEGGPNINPDILFQAGSVSKCIAAAAALHLVQEGKLDLDKPINDQLKSWKIPDNAMTRKTPVTLRQLLSHTGGINVHGFSGYDPNQKLPTLLEILNGKRPANSTAIDVILEPGTKYEYSGGGYTIIQQAMIDASGMTYDKVLQETVLDPVGMKHSHYQQPLAAKFANLHARPFDKNGQPEGIGHAYPELAAAGLWTTPSDLALWAMEIQQSIKGNANHILNKENTKLMLTPVMNNYGLGVHIGHKGGRTYFWHDGVNVGFRTYLICFENGDGVVVMSNGDDGAILNREFASSVESAYGWPVIE